MSFSPMTSVANLARRVRNRGSELLNTPTDNKEDAFSKLSDDLLRLVFTKLDYDTLDKMSAVSRKMFQFANNTKQMRPKEKLKRITIKQREDNGDFFIDVTKSDAREKAHYGGYSVESSDEINFYMIVKAKTSKVIKGGYASCKVPKQIKECQKSRKIVAKRSSIPAPIFEGISYLLSRFGCETIVFQSVLIDNFFMFTVDSFPMGESELHFYTTYVMNNDEMHAKSFLTWLVSLHTKGYTVLCPSVKVAVTSDWMMELLEKPSPDTKLHIFRGFSSNVNLPAEVPIELLSKFSTLDIPELIVDASTFIEVIKLRFLGERRIGQMNIGINRHIDRDEIEAKLGEYVKIEDGWPGNTELHAKDSTDYIAIIYGMRPDFANVEFYKREGYDMLMAKMMAKWTGPP